MEEKHKEFDGKLIPVLREGVEVVKMILFIKLKGYISEREADWPKEYQSKIIGAVLNDIFGILHPEQQYQKFAEENKIQTDKIIFEVPIVFAELLIPLTDALRTAVLCDYQEGIDNSAVLAQAQKRGLLLAERDLPMPNRFIELVRRLGSSLGLVVCPPLESQTS